MTELVRLNMCADVEGGESKPFWINPDGVEFITEHPRYKDRCILFMWGSGKMYELAHTCEDAVDRISRGKVKLT